MHCTPVWRYGLYAPLLRIRYQVRGIIQKVFCVLQIVAAEQFPPPSRPVDVCIPIFLPLHRCSNADQNKAVSQIKLEAPQAAGLRVDAVPPVSEALRAGDGPAVKGESRKIKATMAE